jgi:hypothetical protein
MKLPKAILDRIHRYAAAGGRLCTAFGPGDYRLLAVELGQVPIVIFRTSERDRFAQMRSEAVVEWVRTSRTLKRR